MARGHDLAFDAAFAEAAWNQNATRGLEDFLRALALDLFSIDLDDFHAAIVGHAAVHDGFVNGFIGVLQFDVLADDPNADAVLRRNELADDLLPMSHVG